MKNEQKIDEKKLIKTVIAEVLSELNKSFRSNANVVLDDVTINQPVADLTALAGIPTTHLQPGCIVMVNADTSVRRWNGTAWKLAGNYLYVADTAPRLALTSTQVNDGQLVSQLSDKTLWIATVVGTTVTWNQVGGVGAFDPFDAIVDGIGTANGHYVNETAAIAAGKAVIFTIAGTLDAALNFLPAVKDILSHENNLRNIRDEELEHNIGFLIRNKAARLVWNKDESVFEEKLAAMDLKAGTLCLVEASKKYYYWDGENWLSPKEAGKAYPFYKVNDTAVITVNRNIVIYRGGATYHLSNQTGFTIAENCTLSIYSSALNNTSSSPTGATLLCNNPIGIPFFDGEGSVNLSGIYCIQGSTGGLFASTIKSFTRGCQAQTFGANNQFFNLQVPGSKIQNSFIFGQAIGAAIDNSVIIGNGCDGDDIRYQNMTGSTGTHITVQPGGKLTRVTGAGQTGGGGFPFVVDNQGYLERVYTSYPISPWITNSGTFANSTLVRATGFATVAAKLTNIGTRPKINNVDFANVDIENDATAVNTIFFESSTTGGTYNDLGENTKGFSNTGLLPNTVPFFSVADSTARLALTYRQVGNGQIVTQLSDQTLWISIVSGTSVSWVPVSSVPGINLSPYSGSIDGVGALSYHYTNFGAAYTAGKTEDYTIANVIETADINFSATDQLYAQIGQNFTWDLSTYSLIGSFSDSVNAKKKFSKYLNAETSGANSLTIEFTDASAIFKWGNSAAGLPISNFDQYSTVTINAKGGVLQNASTDANCYLYCAGTFILRDGILLLPNASNGGIKTTSYTQISGLELTGGGSACDTALTCEGGSLRDIILDGEYTDNSTLIQTNKDTAFDAININVGINGTIEVMGKASKIFSSNLTGFVIVQAKTSLDPYGNTGITDSNFDQLSLSTGTTGIKVSDCTIGILDLPADNSTSLELSNVTILNSCSLYGKVKMTNCKFPNGFIPESGLNIQISTSESGVSISSWTGVTKSRAANDTNIGNDY